VKRVAGVLLAMALLLGACTSAGGNAIVSESEDPSGYRGAYLTDPYRMPDQTLTDTSGRDFNLRTSPSKPVVLMFFGYTHCPDVCVSTLADVALALNQMEPHRREQVQMILVTTDPARDTGPVMRKYLDRIDPTFIGLTGRPGTIKTVADRLGVSIEGEEKLPGGGYDVVHSAQVIGFDKMRNGVVVWTPGTPVGDLRHDIELLVSRQQ
jgi:protein SCO1